MKQNHAKIDPMRHDARGLLAFRKGAIVRPSVADAIARAESASGKKVVLEYDNSISTFAIAKIAQGSEDAHRIICHPEHGDIVDHVIVHECGHIIRMFMCPPERRYVPVSNAEIRQAAWATIADDMARMEGIYKPVVINKVKEIWYDGIVKQITNQPPDTRIEQWIFETYPDLRELQLASLQKQCKAGVASLTNDVKKATPEILYAASNAMNYAFYRMIGERIGVNLVKAYSQHQQHVRKGMELIGIAESIYAKGNSYAEDIEVSSRWAMSLGLSRWFAWYIEEDE